MKELSRQHSAVPPSSAMAVDQKVKQMRSVGINVLSFGAGEPDFETPDHIREAGIRAIQAGKTRYTPAAGAFSLRNAIARRTEQDTGAVYNEDQIVVSNGAKACLNASLMALLDPGDEVILPSPYWVSNPPQIRLNGGVPVLAEATREQGYKLTPQQLEALITPQTKALLLNNPCNPTGVVYSRTELEALSEVCVRRDLFIISDEVYSRLCYDGITFASVSSLGEEVRRRSIVINGVSKSYAMTGWRCGYALCGDVRMAEIMSTCLGHTMGSIGEMNQAAMEEALRGPQECVEAMRREFEARRDYVLSRLGGMPYLTFTKPQGAFYVLLSMDGLKGKSLGGREITCGDDFANAFLEQELVAVVPCRDFGTPNAVRWSFAASMEDLKEGLDRLERFLS